ncbi:IS3 family transposase [Bacillus mycoides]|uniref:IS3 family transposase n=1 Tax=Bacillus mycoides TaxID=1405 RepID=UPI000872FBF6|nr:IS3 family transposase [Bacillus mycoides]
MIRNNAHKYSISAMCAILTIPKSTYYYYANLNRKRALEKEEKELSKEIPLIFKKSRNKYGTRKTKKELAKLVHPKPISRHRIGRFMNQFGLVSNYTVAQYKPHHSMYNESSVKNELQRQFNQENRPNVLTYYQLINTYSFKLLYFLNT